MADAATALVESPATADTVSYKRLTDAERALILKLNEAGLTQPQIAQRLDRAQSTISDVLNTFQDTTGDAKRYLRAKALPMAENIVSNGLPRDHIAALKGIGVLQDDAQQGFTVNIGIAESAVSLTLSPPFLQGQERKVENP